MAMQRTLVESVYIQLANELSSLECDLTQCGEIKSLALQSYANRPANLLTCYQPTNIYTYTRKHPMNTNAKYKASTLVKAGIDPIRTFGRELTKVQQVEALKFYAKTKTGIKVYFLDGDWMVYRIK